MIPKSSLHPQQLPTPINPVSKPPGIEHINSPVTNPISPQPPSRPFQNPSIIRPISSNVDQNQQSGIKLRTVPLQHAVLPPIRRHVRSRLNPRTESHQRRSPLQQPSRSRITPTFCIQSHVADMSNEVHPPSEQQGPSRAGNPGINRRDPR